MTRKVAFLLAGACALPVFVTPAFAQDTAQDDPANATESSGNVIIVTANKREENLQEVPISITAFSQEELDRRGVTGLEGIQESTPNLNFSAQSADANVARVTLRGIGTETLVGGGDPGVALHIDGVYVGRNSAAAGDVFDVARVEVLRGPQGTLYGRNATGGSVNIITQRPVSTVEGYADVSYGNYNALRVRGVLNVPLTDTLSSRVAIFSDSHDGYYDNLYEPGRDAGDKHTTGGRLQLLWEPTDTAEVLVRGYFQNSEGVGPGSRFLGADIATANGYPAIQQIGAGSGGQRMQARLELEHDLRGALHRHELTLDYQPRFDLATGAVTSAEALVRWLHPEHGPVSPTEFIPVAEATGLILPLGEQVLSMAVEQAKAWQDAGSPWRVAVNVSAKQLACSDFAGNVQKELTAHALDPDRLELELTESAAVKDLDETAAQLCNLRKLGVRVALDDFGTAYSSLTQLKRLPLDVLKIDQAFVRDLTAEFDAEKFNEDNSGEVKPKTCGAEIVKTVIALGRSLGLVVVAEGVETRAQLELLRDLGCQEIQGYYLARPQPAAALAATFQTQNGKPRLGWSAEPSRTSGS